MRKLDNPIITGYEFHILNLVSYTCPKALILPYLRETLAELKKRKPDAKNPYRARVAIVGSEIDDPSLTKLIEGRDIQRTGLGCSESHRDAVVYVEEDLRNVIAGVAEDDAAVLLRLPYQLVVGVFQKVFKVDQMLQIFQMFPLPS